MKKKILLPIVIDYDNKQLFVSTLELAGKLSADVICFTSVADEWNLDRAYLHYLGLYGHYQTTTNNWSKELPNVKKVMRIGIMLHQVAKYLKQTEIDIVISNPKSNVLDANFLEMMLVGSPYKPEIITFDKLAS